MSFSRRVSVSGVAKYTTLAMVVRHLAFTCRRHTGSEVKHTQHCWELQQDWTDAYPVDCYKARSGRQAGTCWDMVPS